MKENTKKARFEMRTDEDTLKMLDDIIISRRLGAHMPSRSEIIHALIYAEHEKIQKKKKNTE